MTSENSARQVRLLGISGSLRKGSFNTAALHAAASVLPEGTTMEIAEIGALPMYNADDERAHGFPPPVERLRNQIRAADALLVATPEYNFSITGALKNAIDWASRPPESPITLKPAAVLGVGGRLGTSRAQRHFRDIALHSDMKMVQKPEVLIAGGFDKFDEHGNLTDERVTEQIRRLVMALRGLTLRMRATRRRVLVIGRDPRRVQRVTGELLELGYAPVPAHGTDDALAQLNPGAFDAVLIGDAVEEDVKALIHHHVEMHAPATALAEAHDEVGLVGALEEALGFAG